MESLLLKEIIRPLLTVGLISFLLFIIKKMSTWMQVKDKELSDLKTETELLKKDIFYIHQQYVNAVTSNEKKLDSLQRSVNKIMDDLSRVRAIGVLKGGRRWSDDSDTDEV